MPPGAPADVRRLDQWLSHCGYCSRHEARAWLRRGRVQVRGAAVADPGLRAAGGEVLVDGEALDHPGPLLVMLHKPAGCVCSHDDAEGPTVFDLLPERWRRRNPALNCVGRLDRDTTGLLLLTDDGELLHRWTSPKHAHPRRYEAELSGEPPPGAAALFASGQLRLGGEESPCLPAVLETLGPARAAVTLTEGRYHQVKRMFAALGLAVHRLHRVSHGEYALDGLAEGSWRVLPLPSSPAR